MRSGTSVCVLTSVHNTFDTRIFHKEAVTLVEAGYDVTLFTPHDSNDFVDGVEINGYPIPENRLERVGLTARMCRDALRGAYDVYHFHDPELLPTGLILEIATSGSVVYDVHEDYRRAMLDREWIPSRLRRAASLSLRGIELVCSTPFSGIVVAADDIRPRFWNNNNVVTVTNYPPRAWAEETPDPTVPTGDHELVYVGKLSRRRGILTLIEAVDHIPEEYDLTLLLGGFYANDSVEREIRRLARDSGRVELLGWLPELSDVIEVFRNSTVGMMCFKPVENMRDGAYRSNKLFQYMGAALPIVVSDVGDWSDLVTDIDCGVPADPKNPKDIAGTVTDLLDSPKRLRQLGRNGRRAVLERYNWETESERLLDLYDDLTDASQSR
jgi:glycosyltransferase involved in cell wall biosynthesis